MKIRQYKRILIYLNILIKKYEDTESTSIDPKIKKYFLKKELIEIVLWLYKDVYLKQDLEKLLDEQLFQLIGNDINLLSYITFQMEEMLTNVVSYSQEEVNHFFSRTQNEIHYLASKPVDEWDAYDKSNYHSQMSKTNSTKKVYGIFTSDVLAEDVYAVTTKPSYFFDTKEEAEAEIANIIEDGKFKRDELTIHQLWLIQDQK